MKRLPLFDEKIIRNLIQKRCDSIAVALKSYYPDIYEPGWMSGLTGISCFFFHYSHITGNDKYRALAYQALEKVIQAIDKGFSRVSFSTGLAGIKWMLNYLGDQKFITKDEANSLNGLHPLFETFATKQFSSGDYDVLHGTLGIYIAATGLGNFPEQDENTEGLRNLEKLIIKELDRLRINTDNNSVFWETTNPIKGYREINLGLAHGIPSILLCLSHIYKRTNDEFVLKELIEPGMNFIFQTMEVRPGEKSIFPIRIKDKIVQRPSRMAWCYGDPGIAQTIFQIGESCINQEWQNKATSILKVASTRLKQIETQVSDACICHGSSGLALIYYSMGRKTAYEPFYKTARKWTRATLDYGNSDSDAAGYLFRGHKDDYIPKHGVLEGISGVGLTLMAMMEGQLPGWEKGFMI